MHRNALRTMRLHQAGLAITLVGAMACVGEPTSSGPQAGRTGNVATQAAYDTIIDLTLTFGGGRFGHAYDISGNGIIVGDQDGLPFKGVPHTTLQILNTPPGLLGGSASAISEDGRWIAGYAGAHAVLWGPAGHPKDLGTLGGTMSVATGVNNAGDVVGWSKLANNNEHAFWYDRSRAKMIDLGRIPGSPRSAQSLAYDINDAGVAVGCGTAPNGNLSMFRWTSSGGMVAVGPSTGLACAYGINANGWVAGVAPGPGGIDDGVSGKPVNLVFHQLGTVALDINLGKIAVGNANLARGYYADRNGVAAYLPDLAPGIGFGTGAEGINDCGDIVGWSEDANSNVHAVAWLSRACPP